ncbi:MAG: hypothetical protein ACR2OZ_18760 [Verrucomicrobiales bacterium]
MGFWEQVTPERKRIVNAQAVKVAPHVYRQLWNPITRADLQRLLAVIKDSSLSLDEARKQAAYLKQQRPYPQAIIRLNPKIDLQQRRLQCSLRFDDFFEHLAPGADRGKQAAPTLFGVRVPSRWNSPPRTFKASTRVGKR